MKANFRFISILSFATGLGLAAGLYLQVGNIPVALPLAQASPLAPENLPDLVDKLRPGVVNISAVQAAQGQAGPSGQDAWSQFWGIPNDRPRTALGSGFIIDEEGYVLTNNHVVDNAAEVLVTLLDKRQFKAKIMGRDPKLDVALLKIQDKQGVVPKGLQPVKMAPGDNVRVAESVIAIGNPFGLQHTVTVGIISAKNRSIGVGPFDNYLQTDASINPGNSGGPLFNMRGEVIGINTLIFSQSGQSGGLGFAIPILEAERILPALKKDGFVPRPWIGVLGETLTPQMRYYYDLPIEKGVVVYGLIEQGPARKVLRRGDIILSVAGEGVEDVMGVERALGKTKPGDTVLIEILRNDQKVKLHLKLDAVPRRVRDRLPRGVI